MLFLVDENLPDSLVALIRSQDHQAVYARAAVQPGADDVLLWDWAARHSAILVTLDLDFPLPGRRPAPFAVILLRPGAETIPALHRLWREFAGERDYDSVRGHVLSVSPGRVRVRPLP